MTHDAPSLQRRDFELCALLALAVALVFGPVVDHPFIAFDDAELILRNPLIGGGAVPLVDRLLTPTVGYVVPLTIAVERFLFWLSAGQAWSFHAAAVGLHALNAGLALLLSRRLGAQRIVSLTAALAFALHPLVVQPVAWAICLKDLLMACFVLCATHAFVTALWPSPGHGRLPAALAIGLALLAMLAKPSASLIGLAFLAAVLAQNASGTPAVASARIAAIGTAGLGLLLGTISRLAHDARMGVEAIAGFTPLFPLNVLGKHLQNVLLLHEPAIAYPHPSGRFDTDAAVGLLGLCAAMAVALQARKRPAPMLMLGIAGALYVPVSTVLPFGRVMSDSYVYLPLCASSIALALIPRSSVARGAVALALIAVSILELPITLAEVPRWRGGDALWAKVVQAQPRSVLVRNLYGDELHFRGESERAVEVYLDAFQIQYDVQRLMHLGSALSMVDRLADAECVLIEAISHGPDPGYASFNYGVLLAFHRDFESRYPGMAKHVIFELDALRRAGKIPWPAALQAGLAVRLERLARVEAEPPSLSRRHCAVLRLR